MAQKILDLISSSVVIQGLVSLILVLTCAVNVATQKPIPDDFFHVTVFVIGFWFGGKAVLQFQAIKLGLHKDDK
jgi:hypothetical protein